MRATHKVIITGGRGYIGSNLGIFLSMQGHDVVYYDLVDGLDVLNTQALVERATGCYTMIHLAAISGVAACNDDPIAAWKTNYLGTVSALLAASHAGVKKVIIASSAAAKNPANAYGKTKAAVEKLCDTTKLAKAWVLRFSNVYGGFGFLEKKDTVVARFLKAVRAGKSVLIHGDGQQRRDFIHVWEICLAIQAIMETEVLPGGAMDICTGITRSIVELADGMGLTKCFMGDGEPVVEPPDPSLAYHVLGWMAKDRMEQDLKKWRSRAKR